MNNSLIEESMLGLGRVSTGNRSPLPAPSDIFAPIARPPVDLSRTGARIAVRAPQLGEHTGAILAESGYSPAEISELQAIGTIMDGRS